LEKFPYAAEALKEKIVVDVHPGEALFIPAQVWHHVTTWEGGKSFLSVCDVRVLMVQ
jgi:quercetin dioxygenase-like cupin family protein